jgi:hypothetical protein
VLDLVGFEEGSVIGQCDRVSTQFRRRRTHAVLTVLKVISLPPSIGRCQIDFRHPMIAGLIRRFHPRESSGLLEFKTVRLNAADGSLADVLMNLPIS